MSGSGSGDGVDFKQAWSKPSYLRDLELLKGVFSGDSELLAAFKARARPPELKKDDAEEKSREEKRPRIVKGEDVSSGEARAGTLKRKRDDAEEKSREKRRPRIVESEEYTIQLNDEGDIGWLGDFVFYPIMCGEALVKVHKKGGGEISVSMDFKSKEGDPYYTLFRIVSEEELNSLLKLTEKPKRWVRGGTLQSLSDTSAGNSDKAGNIESGRVSPTSGGWITGSPAPLPAVGGVGSRAAAAPASSQRAVQALQRQGPAVATPDR